MDAKTTLVIIDPQNDFCDIPESERPGFSPALPVAGADADMKRLAALIDRSADSIERIIVTLDSHQPVDIAHPAWWENAAGESPAPFTVITAADIEEGNWRARNRFMQAYSLAYTEALESSGRYALVVWPEHCLIGTWGVAIHGAVKAAIDSWARASMRQVEFVFKGMNPRTEHYSAVRAEVPDPTDVATQTNGALLDGLRESSRILVAGEALSHCVANTVRDIVADVGPDAAVKMVLLNDCTSSVAGFEQLGADFITDMQNLGMQMIASTDI